MRGMWKTLAVVVLIAGPMEGRRGGSQVVLRVGGESAGRWS